MCLSGITKQYPEPDEQEHVGYKVFYYSCPGLMLEGTHTPDSFHFNQWCKANLPVNRTPDYLLGFHVFPNFADAKHYKSVGFMFSSNYQIFKVVYRRLRTEGYENLYKPLLVHVADEIKILDEATPWEYKGK